MKQERELVAEAVAKSPNLNVAAREVGASRRTLQNRMREYGLPYGKSGRRRRDLAGPSDLDGALVPLVVIAGAVSLGYWLLKRKDPTFNHNVLGIDTTKLDAAIEVDPAALRGLDLLLRRR